MDLPWFRRRVPRKVAPVALPTGWDEHLAGLPFAGTLSAQELARLVGLAREFEATMTFEAREGLELDQSMVRAVALQACRLILKLDLGAYRKVRAVILYPDVFEVRTVTAGEPMRAAGLAVQDGPVHLAWNHVELGGRCNRDGRNVVYHEFAHKLDMLDGFLDGVPALGELRRFLAWKSIVARERSRLRLATRRGEETLLHPYGAQSTVEFFAEATEVFFERPRLLRERHRSLYRALARFYGQSPLE